MPQAVTNPTHIRGAKTGPNPKPAAKNSRQDPKQTDASSNRSWAKHMAKVGTDVAQAAGSTVRDAAMQTASGGTNMALNVAHNTFSHWIQRNIGHTLYQVCGFPIVGPMIADTISKIIFPQYHQLNPNTNLDAKNFSKLMQQGRIEDLVEDIAPIFTNYLAQHLSEEEQASLMQGNNALLVKAFSKALYDKTVGTAASLTKPGGAKNTAIGIANFIPFIKNLSPRTKLIAGGVIGVGVGIIALRIAWRILKWGIGIVAALTGMKWLAGKFKADKNDPTLKQLKNLAGAATNAAAGMAGGPQQGGGTAGALGNIANAIGQMAKAGAQR